MERSTAAGFSSAPLAALQTNTNVIKDRCSGRVTSPYNFNLILFEPANLTRLFEILLSTMTKVGLASRTL